MDESERPAPASLPRFLGRDFTAQFASSGSDHDMWINGQFLGSVTDSTHSARASSASRRTTGLQEHEKRTLDGLSEAEALKAAGIEE